MAEEGPERPEPPEPTRLSPTSQEARRHLDRLADRLRVMGPRLAGRSASEATEKLQAVRAGLQRLADLAAEADGRPAYAVPELAVHALADQALVLGNDLLTPPQQAQRPDSFRSRVVEAVDAVYALL